MSLPKGLFSLTGKNINGEFPTTFKNVYGNYMNKVQQRVSTNFHNWSSARNQDILKEFGLTGNVNTTVCFDG